MLQSSELAMSSLIFYSGRRAQPLSRDSSSQLGAISCRVSVDCVNISYPIYMLFDAYNDKKDETLAMTHWPKP
jgi:hypothetical protein